MRATQRTSTVREEPERPRTTPCEADRPALLISSTSGLEEPVATATNARLRAHSQATREDLPAAAEQASALLETTGEGLYTLDRSGRCVWANPAAARIFGYPDPGQLTGRVMHDLIHHTREDGTPFPAEECRGMENLRAGEGVVQPNELLWRADGTSFRAHTRVNPIIRGGAVIGAAVAVTDMSERLRLEEQARQAQKMEAVGRLSAGIAHDFNNLLTVINGYAELLQTDAEVGPKARLKAGQILEAGARAAKLTRQLLDFGRRREYQPTWLDLNDAVTGMAAMLRRTLGEVVLFRTELTAPLPLIWADGGEIEQALLNLAVNARDAMPDGGELTLATAQVELASGAVELAAGLAAGPHLTLTVADSGVGMDAETQRHIFEPFFTTKPKGKGTGLGLSTVYAIVRQCRGAVLVDSAPGQGARFTLYFPVTREVGVAREDEP